MKTVREAAAILDYDEAHVRRLCIEGKLKGKKFGWMWTISEKSIRTWRRKRLTSEDAP